MQGTKKNIPFKDQTKHRFVDLEAVLKEWQNGALQLPLAAALVDLLQCYMINNTAVTWKLGDDDQMIL